MAADDLMAVVSRVSFSLVSSLIVLLFTGTLLSTLIEHKKNATHRPSYTILFHALPYQSIMKFVIAALRQHPVDVFVVVGYHEEPDALYTDCRMFPPTMLSINNLKNTNYANYSSTLVSSVERVSTKTPSWPTNITRALSIGMGGRWYEPCGSAAASKLGDKCGSACRKHKLKPSAQIVSIMEGCRIPELNQTFNLDKKFQAIFGYHKRKNFAFTYDSPFTLRSKMCHAKANATRISYALAAQDIQFDDPSGDCGYGPYPRLHMMKKLSEFFAFNYKSSAQEKMCAQIA